MQLVYRKETNESRKEEIKELKLHHDNRYGYFIIHDTKLPDDSVLNVEVSEKGPNIVAKFPESRDPDWTSSKDEEVSIANFQSGEYESSDGMSSRRAGTNQTAAKRKATKCWSRTATRWYAFWAEPKPQLPDWSEIVHNPKTADGTIVEETLPTKVIVYPKKKVNANWLGSNTKTSDAENALLAYAIEHNIDL